MSSVLFTHGSCIAQDEQLDAKSAQVRVQNFRGTIQPFFKQYCVRCHGADTQEGGLRLDTISFDLSSNRETAEHWREISQRLLLGEMPPKDELRPEERRLNQLVSGIVAELQRAVNVLRSKGGGEAVLRRLNKKQFNNTIHDIFGLENNFAAGFPEDGVEHGFDNIGTGLILSAGQLQSYMTIADKILQEAIVAADKPPTTTIAFRLVEPAGLGTTKFQPRQAFRVPLTQHQGNGVIIDRRTTPRIQRKFRAKLDGRYRIGITAYAIRNDGKRIRLAVERGAGYQREDYSHVGQAVLREAVPRHFEFTAFLKKGMEFGLFSPDVAGYIKPDQLPTYKGPGIAVQKVEIEGPLYNSWPPQSHQIIFGSSIRSTYSDEEVLRILERFATTLFRRPAPAEEVKAYFSFYHQARKDGEDSQEALSLSLKAILCSPYFLYLHEKPGKLEDYALASRLSYFLWGSVPDKELLDLAAQRKLSQADVLKQQVARMIADPKIRRFASDFVDQWLEVSRVGEMQPDVRLYPEYDDYLERAMPRETREFFREVLVNNLSIENFINSDFAMLNDRLAKHYGIEGVVGEEFRRVTLPPNSHRGGLLTHASVLTVTSNGTTTSPVVRGAWLLTKFLRSPPPPPPPIAASIVPDIRGAVTIKEQLAKHRTLAQCNVCHAKIDPYGLALENFDVTGAWREHYRKIKPGAKRGRRSNRRFDQYEPGPEVEAFAEAPNFGQFDGFESFRKLLMKRKATVARCVTENLLIYALGRGLTITDDPTVDSILENLKHENDGLKSLVEQIVLSDAFQTN